MNAFKFPYRRLNLVCSCLALILIASLGCSNLKDLQVSKEKVLKSDPGFLKVLQKKNEVANKISQMEKEILLKQSQIDRQISQLKKEAAEARVQVNLKINQAKALLDPELQRIDLALSLANEELRSKLGQRASLKRSIQRLKKALKVTSQNWSDAQRKQTQKDMDEFIQEANRLDAEISSLKSHIALLKNKKDLLKL
jgi:chromosome segregation ATPase